MLICSYASLKFTRDMFFFWDVRFAAKVYVFLKAFERFVERFAERQLLLGDDGCNIGKQQKSKMFGPPQLVQPQK